MQAAQVVGFGEPVVLKMVEPPALTAPTDVIVRVAGSGLCRTDLHIVRGDLKDAFSQRLPLTLGHENSGWVHAVGSAVSAVRVGDPVLVHPAVTCGYCAGCRSGNDLHCANWRFPGVDGWPGGYAEFLRTTERAVVPLPADVDPTPLAPHADAGLTAMHAVRRLAPYLRSDSSIVVWGAGGVGKVAIQLLRLLTAATVLVVEPDERRAQNAAELGAHEVFTPAGAAAGVAERTSGRGAAAILDLVGEADVPRQALEMLGKGGVYSVVGYGGKLELDLLDAINRELTVIANQIGSFTELCELAGLVCQGRVTLPTALYPLDAVADAFADVTAGRQLHRVVFMPAG